jgi:ATP-dependent helicase HrpA
MLPGLLSHIGFREGEATDYLGARGARFSVAPGSVLPRPRPAGTAGAKRAKNAGPRWVMATELVETARLFARDCAVIEPDWVEPVAGHLVRRTYSEPRWNATRGQVEATEKVTLYGIPLVAARPSATPASTRGWRASCSCATRWSSGTGSPGTPSWRPTRR